MDLSFISHRSKKSVGLRFLFLSLMSLVSAGALAGGPPPAPVAVAPAVERELWPTTWVAGSVISRNDARVAAEVPGRLEWVAEVGDYIKESQPVARIEDTDLRLEREEYLAEVDRDRARLTFLEQEVERLTRLAAQNNAAQTRLDQTRADLGVARGELATARARLRQVEEHIRRSAVAAPFSGTVVQRLARPGEWVGSGDRLVRLVDPDALEVQAMVPLSSMSYLHKGLEMALSSGETRDTGRLRSFVTAGDVQSRLLDLRMEFDEPTWISGQTVRVAVPNEAPRVVVAVPRDALVLRRSGTAVYRLTDDGTAERVPVTTGIAQGGLIEVRGEIVAGDRVIVRGNERLRPGQAVQVIGGSEE